MSPLAIRLSRRTQRWLRSLGEGWITTVDKPVIHASAASIEGSDIESLLLVIKRLLMPDCSITSSARACGERMSLSRRRLCEDSSMDKRWDFHIPFSISSNL